MDDGAAKPVSWWQAALLGAGAAVPIVWAVWALADDVSSLDGLGGVVVFIVWGPVIVLAAAALGWIMAFLSSEQRPQRWRHYWLIAAPFAMWVVLLAAALTSGPTSSVEQRLGWSLVVVLMYATTGVAFAGGVSPRVRVLASVVVLAAAPAMIAFDDVSQHRWRKATFAAAPHVLPAIPGYSVAAAGGDGPRLELDMRGPADLWVTVQRCRDCTVRREYDIRTLTMVDGTFELEILVFGDQPGQWPDADGISVCPAGLDELASLPRAVFPSSD